LPRCPSAWPEKPSATGGLGERIKVRNLSSQKVLEGAVEADGSVSMAF